MQVNTEGIPSTCQQSKVMKLQVQEVDRMSKMIACNAKFVRFAMANMLKNTLWTWTSIQTNSLVLNYWSRQSTWTIHLNATALITRKTGLQKCLSTDEDYTIEEEFPGEVAWLFIVIKTRILHNNLKLERKYNMVLSIVINCHDMFKLIR